MGVLTTDRFNPTAIDLARELAGSREFRVGDWYLRTGVPRCWSNVHGDPLTSSVTYPWPVVWLPSVEDCLDLLREAGYLERDLCYLLLKNKWQAWCRKPDAPASQFHAAEGQTPLEVMYRLLLECGIGQTTTNSKED